MVNFAVIFHPDMLAKKGIPVDRQAQVYVHEFFGVPAGEIIGYTGDSGTARKIAKTLRKSHNNGGRLRKLKEEELKEYSYFVSYLLS